MIDELSNDQLIAHVRDSDPSEVELELVERLYSAIEEIHRLVATVKELETVNGDTRIQS